MKKKISKKQLEKIYEKIGQVVVETSIITAMAVGYVGMLLIPFMRG